MIGSAADDELTRGFAAQNQLYATAAEKRANQIAALLRFEI